MLSSPDKLVQVIMETPLTITETAIVKIKELIKKEKKKNVLLRVQVMPGGCSGYQYGLGFDDTVTKEDETFTVESVKICVDKQSLSHLKGTTLDYIDGFQGAWFKFTNPNAKSTCGCGKSFY